MTPTIDPPNKPNLFRFAPSELSQDAFLAWLLSWSSSEAEDCVKNEGLQCLQKASRAFLGLLLGKGDVTTTAKIVEVLLQWEKVDLYFHGVEENGDPFSLVIEDKTGTGGHDNQLERYKAAAKKEGHGRLYLAYLKTGWWSPDDQRDLSGYTPIKREDVIKCLCPFRSCHPIFDDYLNHLEKIQEDIVKAEKDALVAGNVAEAFKSHAGLHAFLKEAFNPSINGEDGTWLERGVGVGGRPWANWSFAWENILRESKCEEGFFWRADTRRGQAILSLRKYWNHGGLVSRKELAAQRFQVYLQAVETAFGKLDSCFIPSKLAARRSSYKEQELLLFTLGDSSEMENVNDPSDLSKALLNEIHPKLERALLSARESMKAEIPATNKHA